MDELTRKKVSAFEYAQGIKNHLDQVAFNKAVLELETGFKVVDPEQVISDLKKSVIENKSNDRDKADANKSAITGTREDEELLMYRKSNPPLSDGELLENSFKASVKDTNPKDRVGSNKAPMSTVSAVVMMEVGVAMLEGALKYGKHNYREAGVRATVYYDAFQRHMMAWLEGEDIDPASGISHVTKAIAGLMVLRDSMIRGNWVDDRPPAVAPGWVEKLDKLSKDLVDKYKEPAAPFTEKKLKF